MKTKRKLLVLCLLFLAIPCWAQENASTQKPVSSTTLLKKTVGFLRVVFLKEGHPWEAKGTGFFVFVEDKRLGENRGFGYLVTNRHIAEPEENGRRFPIQGVFLRLNLNHPEEGHESVESVIPLGGALHWYFPPDDSVDLAVLPLAPNQEKFDVAGFPFSMFATKSVLESEQISEGDPVLFTGYFYNFPGLKRIQPIVREGVLAMMPGEEMETTLHKAGHLYLADVHVFGGNSGAPLFVNVRGFRNGTVTAGGFPFRLLGIVSGYFTEDSDFKLTVATTLEGTVKGNSGISTVVPAEDLKALLELPELQRQRDAEVARQTPKK